MSNNPTACDVLKIKKGSYGSEVDQQSKNKSEVCTLFDVDVMYSSIQILHFGTSEGREQYHIQKVSVPKKGNLFNNVK